MSADADVDADSVFYLRRYDADGDPLGDRERVAEVPKAVRLLFRRRPSYRAIELHLRDGSSEEYTVERPERPVTSAVRIP